MGLGPIMAFLYNVHFNVFSVYNALERRTPARMGVVIAVCAGVWGRAAGLELGVDGWVLVICLGGWGGEWRCGCGCGCGGGGILVTLPKLPIVF